MDVFLTEILPLLGTGSIISGLVLHQLKKMDKRAEEREEARKEESKLLVEGVKVDGDLAREAALSIKRGHHNGELDGALERHGKYRGKLNEFLADQSAERNYG